MLGEYLQRCRKQAGFTQNQVAKSLGYTSPQYISNVERGVCLPCFKELSKYTTMIGADTNKVKNGMLTFYKNKIEKALEG